MIISGKTTIAIVIALGTLLAGCGGSSGSPAANNGGAFIQTNLVADTSGKAANTDPNLVNPWGISFSPAGPFWISDNGSGKSTFYDGTGALQGTVGIPNSGPVSGQVYNGTSDFTIPGQGTAVFIFDGEDGTISAWNGSTGASAVTVANRSGTGAVYKGLAMANSGGANLLYATNFNSGQVDVFDTNFNYLSSFTDSTIPTGFAPFGIADFGGKLYVTFAKQDAAKHDDVAGSGNGYVDVFNPNGTLVNRLVSQGGLNSPWGLAIAPSGFGSLGGDLLVGNFGNGWINAYNPSSGASVGYMKSTSGQAIAIDGLWGLSFGNGGGAGSTGSLYFTAGPNHEANGLFGSITPSP